MTAVLFADFRKQRSRSCEKTRWGLRSGQGAALVGRNKKASRGNGRLERLGRFTFCRLKKAARNVLPSRSDHSDRYTSSGRDETEGMEGTIETIETDGTIGTEAP